jgi:chromosome segregation ATPase
MSDLDQELEQVLKRRKTVASEIERLKGRREQADATKQSLEDECRAKKIDPDKIEETLTKLEEKYSALVEELKRDTEAAEVALAPYVGGNGTP